MVSEIEVEIAMTIIQLTGVLLPILAGSTGYYLIHKDEIDKLIQSHDETVDDASIRSVFEALHLCLFLSYFFAISIIISDVNLFLIFSLAFYGVFLLTAITGLLIVLDASLANFAKKVAVFLFSVPFIIFLSIVVVILIFWNAELVLFSSLVLLLLFVLWIAHTFNLTDMKLFPRSNPKPDKDDDSEDTEECN